MRVFPIHRHLTPAVAVVLTITTFFSCNSLRKLQLMKSGHVVQSGYLETIDFEYSAKIPIIKAVVNGHEGRFLFDTGAPNVLSPAFARKLKLENRASGNVEDSGGHVLEGQSYVNINEMILGKVSFKDVGAIIVDLSKTQVLKCLALDGVIGANLMRNAFWRIDYQNQRITFTDELDRLEIADGYKELTFKHNSTQSTPKIDLVMDGVKVKGLTFDTGSNGYIKLPKKALRLQMARKNVPTTYSVGATSYGVGGKAKNDTLFYSSAEKLTIGNIALEHRIVGFSHHGDIVGNEFFEHYDVVLDWKDNKIYMREVKEDAHNTLVAFGFSRDWRKDGIYVGAIYRNSDAEGKLKVGDQITRIDNLVFKNLSNEEICELFNGPDWGRYKKQDVIEIEVLRDSETHRFTLKKKQLLPVVANE